MGRIIVLNNAYKKPYVPFWERNFSEHLFSWLRAFCPMLGLLVAGGPFNILADGF